MLKNTTKDFPKLKGNLQKCHPCMLGKAHLKPFNSRFDETKYAGEIVHSDVATSLPVSVDGNTCMCTFQDQHTRFVTATAIKSKGEVSKATKDYENRLIVQKYFKSEKIERLHSDGGGEYESDPVENLSLIHI